MSVAEDAAQIAGELTRLRREIHQDPEIGLDLPRTQAQGARRAGRAAAGDHPGPGAELGHRGAARRQPGPTVLLRGDMDALPVTERTGLPYASAIDGAMHACGHDLHTAMLAGAARLLSARQAELAGNVIFMFQPGEEGPGGAEIMIAEGVLDAAGERPVAAYALHVASASSRWRVSPARPGPMMAAADILTSPCAAAAGTPRCRTTLPTRCRPRVRWCSPCRRW